MNYAVSLTLGTLPVAGFLITSEQDDWHDLVIISYLCAVGILISLGAMLENAADPCSACCSLGETLMVTM